MQRRRLALLLAVATSGAAAAVSGLRLATFNVPGSLAFACASAVFSAVLRLVLHVADLLSTTTHRCPAADCDFQVKLRHSGAGESRRWQEIAAAHPDHGYLP